VVGRRRLPPVLLLLLAALAVSGLARWREGRAALVAEVVDGDTLRLATGEHVRLIGVDAPETDGPYTRVEPLGPEVAAFVRRVALGRHVRLEFDRERRDPYGRTLAYVSVDGLDLNADLLRRGYARAYRRFPHRRLAEFLDLERAARAASRGIWGASHEPLDAGSPTGHMPRSSARARAGGRSGPAAPRP
jgi:micrococcal nuclease